MLGGGSLTKPLDDRHKVEGVVVNGKKLDVESFFQTQISKILLKNFLG